LGGGEERRRMSTAIGGDSLSLSGRREDKKNFSKKRERGRGVGELLGKRKGGEEKRFGHFVCIKGGGTGY